MKFKLVVVKLEYDCLGEFLQLLTSIELTTSRIDVNEEDK